MNFYPALVINYEFESISNTGVIEMNSDRSWMYKRFENSQMRFEFHEKVKSFVESARQHSECMYGEWIKCPCSLAKCRNKQYLLVKDVMFHLVKNGFVENYYVWNHHGELFDVEEREKVSKRAKIDMEELRTTDRCTQMVLDAAGPELVGNSNDNDDYDDESSNSDTQRFYDVLVAANKPLWPGCTKHTELSLISRLMSVKSEGQMSENNFDSIVELMSEIVLDNNVVPMNFYNAKKKMRGMGLPMEKIDCCKNLCMIYWEDDKDELKCKFCGEKRYSKYKEGAANKRQKGNIPVKRMYYFPLTPRLKRFYASPAFAKDMKWYAEHTSDGDEGKMEHPSDSPAWKHFDNKYPDFAAEIRNVRLGLCTDGFNPFRLSVKDYSCWPVILTPYNLPS